jgi:hypothetical protein
MWYIVSTCSLKDSRIALGFLKLQYHSSSSSSSSNPLLHFPVALPLAVAVGHLVLLLQRLLGILVCLNLVLFLEQAVCLWIKMYTYTHSHRVHFVSNCAGWFAELQQAQSTC